MASLFIAYRYVVFVLFVLCSVVTIGIAAWNLGLAQTLLLPGSSSAADGFLIFVGALGAVCLLPIMFIDLLCKNVFTSQVKFEVTLMGVFWLLQITGAAAMTVTRMNSTVICLPASPQASIEYCTSSTVLLTFSWIAAANSLIYFCTLTVLAIMRHSDDQQVWKANTLEYPWVGARESLDSVSPSPMKGGKKPFVLSAVPRSLADRTSFAARMFIGKQVSDPEKQEWQQPTTAAMSQPRMQQHARQVSNGPSTAQLPQHTRSASTGSTSSSSSTFSGYSSSDTTPLSPAQNPRHVQRKKRSLHLHRPPPLDLTLVTSLRAAARPANSQH